METPKDLITHKKTEKPLNTGDTGASASVLDQYLSTEDTKKINAETLKQKTTEGEKNPEDPESKSELGEKMRANFDNAVKESPTTSNVIDVSTAAAKAEEARWNKNREIADKIVSTAAARIALRPELIKDPQTIKEINDSLDYAPNGTLPKEIAKKIAEDNPEFFLTMITNQEAVKDLTSSEVVDMIIDKGNYADLLSRSYLTDRYLSTARVNSLTSETIEKIFKSGEITRDAQYLIMSKGLANKGNMATALLENSRKDSREFQQAAELIVKNFNNIHFSGSDKKEVWEQLKTGRQNKLVDQSLVDQFVDMSL